MDQPEHSKDRVIEIDINQLQTNPLQPRGVITPDSVTDLVQSIKEHGVLEPLVVAHTPAGYQIIVGERRWRASRIAGRKTVPCLVKETSPKGMLELALVENVQREDLNPLERAKAFQRLVEEFAFSKMDIARRISKSAPYISNTLKLLTLPDAIKDGLLSGLISEGHARALLGIQDVRLMIEAYKLVLKESASVRGAEEIVRRMRLSTGQKPTKHISEAESAHLDKYILDERTDKMEGNMRKALGKKVRVVLRRSVRQTKLYINLVGSPQDTEKELQKIYEAILGINPHLEGGQ